MRVHVSYTGKELTLTRQFRSATPAQIFPQRHAATRKLENAHQNNYHDRPNNAGATMTAISNFLKVALLLLVMLGTPKVWAQGPPIRPTIPRP